MKFMKIVDALNYLYQSIDMIGVVIETGFPKKTKGPDYIVSIKIVDESRSTPPLLVNIFYERMEKLPRLRFEGDIIILRDVQMKNYEKEGKREFYIHGKKNFTTFALFDGKSGRTLTPYQHSENFPAKPWDSRLIIALRKWMTDPPVPTVFHDCSTLSQFEEVEHHNLLCQVLHMYEINKDEWMIFVWDGTDLPSLQLMNMLQDEVDNPLPLCFETFALPRDILCSFPSVGSVLRIKCINDENLNINFLKSRNWVKFMYLKRVINDGLWHAELTSKTRMCYIPEENEAVVQRQRLHEKRLSGAWTCVPSTCFPWHSNLTETEFPQASFISLMHALTHPHANANFRCVVRFVAMLPWEVDNLRFDGIYRVRFTVEDPTARIRASLCGDEGVEFFENHASGSSMTMKRNKLLGISEAEGEVGNNAGRNPPWVDCCFRSYYNDNNDKMETRRFFIFGTRFLG